MAEAGVMDGWLGKGQDMTTAKKYSYHPAQIFGVAITVKSEMD